MTRVCNHVFCDEEGCFVFPDEKPTLEIELMILRRENAVMKETLERLSRFPIPWVSTFWGRGNRIIPEAMRNLAKKCLADLNE